MPRACRRAALTAVVALGLILLADAAFAQCAMCRTALEQNGEMAAGFNKGILFLLGMPYLVFGSIALAWYLKRRKFELAMERRAPAAPAAPRVSESPI